MKLYERNITSVLAQFPSQQIAAIIDGYVYILMNAQYLLYFYFLFSTIVMLQPYKNEQIVIVSSKPHKELYN